MVHYRSSQNGDLPADYYQSDPVVELQLMIDSDTWGTWVLRREG